MNIDTTTAFAHDNEFQLALTIATPVGNPRGIVLFVPGIYETSDMFQPVFEPFLKEQFICASYDHRGTGKSIHFESEIGYLGKDGATGLVQNIYVIIQAISKMYSGLAIFLVTHDYASLMAINFLKEYDDRIRALALINPIALYTGLKRQRLFYEYTSIATPTYFRNQFMNQMFYRRVEKRKGATLPFLYATKSLYHLCEVGYMVQHQGTYYLRNTNLPIFMGVGEKDHIREYGSETKNLLSRIGYHNIDYRTYPEGTHNLFQDDETNQLIHDLLLFFTLSL